MADLETIADRLGRVGYGCVRMNASNGRVRYYLGAVGEERWLMNPTPLDIARAAVAIGCPHTDEDHPGALDVAELAWVLLTTLLGHTAVHRSYFWNYCAPPDEAHSFDLLTPCGPDDPAGEKSRITGTGPTRWAAALALLRQVVEAHDAR